MGQRCAGLCHSAAHTRLLAVSHPYYPDIQIARDGAASRRNARSTAHPFPPLLSVLHHTHSCKCHTLPADLAGISSQSASHRPRPTGPLAIPQQSPGSQPPYCVVTVDWTNSWMAALMVSFHGVMSAPSLAPILSLIWLRVRERAPSPALRSTARTCARGGGVGGVVGGEGDGITSCVEQFGRGAGRHPPPVA